MMLGRRIGNCNLGHSSTVTSALFDELVVICLNESLAEPDADITLLDCGGVSLSLVIPLFAVAVLAAESYLIR